MHLTDNELRFLLFVTGLSFVALGAIVLLANRRTSGEKAWRWLALASALEGVADWTAVLRLPVGEPVAMKVARLLLAGGCLMALIEFGRNRWPRRWLLGRWIYAPLIAALVIGPALGWFASLELACRVLLAIQAGGMAALFFIAANSRLTAAMIGVSALAAYLPAHCLQIHVLRLLAVLVAVVAIWIADRESQAAGHRCRWVLQSRLPAVFVLALLAGWFSIGRDYASDGSLFVRQDSRMAAVEFVDAAPTPSPNSPVAAVWKIALITGPIAAFVLLLRAASKLPFVH